MAAVVQASHRMGNVVQAASDFHHHKVRVVALGYRSHEVALFDAGIHQYFLVVANAHKRRAVEIAAQSGKRRSVAVDDAHVVIVLGKHQGQARSNAPAAHNDHITHFPRCTALRAAHLHLERIVSRATKPHAALFLIKTV